MGRFMSARHAGMEMRVIKLKMSDPKVQQELLSAPFHRWSSEDGSDWCFFYRFDSEYLLRFPDLADFSINSPTLDIMCSPVPGVSGAVLTQLYFNQILPLVQSHSGELVFHASAIVIDELAIAFVGVSGRGKSTLAASFSSNDYKFLTDDGLLVKRVGGVYQVNPSHPSIRLWEDSQAAILGTDAQSEAPLDYTSKLRFPASDKILHYDKPCPLHRVYFLGDSETSEITFTKLSPQEAMVELIKHSFILDVVDRKIMAKHFDAISKISSLDNFYRLDYPRNYDELANVRRIILEHAGLSNKKLASNA